MPGIAIRHWLRAVAMAVSICWVALSAMAGQTGRSAADENHLNQETGSMPATHRDTLTVTIPNLRLTRQDGTTAYFPKELDGGEPVILAFIFTTCKAACPLLTHTMKGVQVKLGDKSKNIRMVSISLDPEYDTPARLSEYARNLGAGSRWVFYTGRYQDIVTLEKAFKIYRGDKMNHPSVIFLRRSPQSPWVIFEGLVRPEAILEELAAVEGLASH